MKISKSESSESIEILEKLADRFARASISESTRRAYERDWMHFWKFCRRHNLIDLPASEDTVVLYLTSMAEENLSVSTIARRCTSITAIHRASGNVSPIKTDRVNRVMRGIKREMAAPPNRKKALSWKDVKKINSICDSTIIGIRDAAIITLGWASALRRSELVALDLDDLDISGKGIIVRVRRSKTDQEGEGALIGIPRSHDDCCPVVAVERWIARLDVTVSKTDKKQIPLFVKIGNGGRGRWWWLPCGDRLSSRSISNIVKHYVFLAGLPADLYSAHSLRRGLATDAGAVGVPERVISRHTRHKSIHVLRGYIEDGTIWHDNPLPTIYGSSSSSSSSLE